jgi:phage-related protein (TIGR01555 family)
MPEEKKPDYRAAAFKAQMIAPKNPQPSYDYPVQAPKLYPGVVPKGSTAPVVAMDSSFYEYAAQAFPGGGFPGFQILASLATRAEYRAFASTMSTELTREWIEFTSKEDDDTATSEKIKQIEEEFKRLNVRGVFQKAAEHDCLFGRGQIFIDIDGAKRDKPLILDPRTVKPGSLKGLSAVEAVWTTPAAFNALDPAAPDFYKPPKWFMLGQEVHATRLLTIVTRELPDILKPAFNFAGMSLSQLAQPYVDNWLRTRQSVADLINNFSITVLATAMDQALQGDDGADLFARADLFTAMRSNKGLMLLDKEREEIVQVNTPLSGLHELQAQSQEHMCSVSRMPAIILTGISPSGLNASSEGEIRVFYDWISAQQEAFWRHPLEVILKVVQLSLFGEIDPDIGIEFVSLHQMTPKEESDIRTQNATNAVAYINAGVIDPSEERERLARDPHSGYQGLDTSIEIVPPNDPQEGIPKKVGEEFVSKDGNQA